jgi:hypothetical protein
LDRLDRPERLLRRGRFLSGSRRCLLVSEWNEIPKENLSQKPDTARRRLLNQCFYRSVGSRGISAALSVDSEVLGRSAIILFLHERARTPFIAVDGHIFIGLSPFGNSGKIIEKRSCSIFVE